MIEPNPTETDQNPELIAAALAARTWVRRRRAAWAPESEDDEPVGVRAPTARPTADAEPGLFATGATASEPPAVPRIAVIADWTATAVGAMVTLGSRVVTFAKEHPFPWKRVAVPAVAALGLSLAGWGGWRAWQHRSPSVPVGTAVLESVPSGSDVSVDGVMVGRTPVTREIGPGHHVIEFRRGKASRTVPLDVVSGGQNVARLDWNVKPTGHLQVESDPSGARVIVDGKDRGQTPLTLDDVVVGAHVVIIKAGRGSVTRKLTVSEGETVRMSEAIFSGWVHLSAPFEVAITEGAHAYTPDERNMVLLAPGVHALQIDNTDLDYHETRRVEVRPGQLTQVVVAPPHSSLTVTCTAPATVTIDGMPAGETPLTNYAVSVGTHDIVVRSRGGAERRMTTTVTSKPAHIDVVLPQ